MKHILLGLLIFTGTICSAQVPGYMGLKFSVIYDAGLMHPAIVGRTGTLPMLYHNLSFDYVVARSVSIGLKYGFMTYNAPGEKLQFDGSTFNNTDYKGRYTQHTVSFIVKRFFRNRGFIAPVGRYMLFGVYYQHATDRGATTFVGGNSYNEHSVSPTGFKGTAEYGGFILGVGRNFIVANRIVIDFGGSVTFPLYYVVDPQVAAGETGTVFRDVVLRNLLEIHVGIGALAF